MKFSQVFKGYFKKYSDFSGRASRSEFWFTYLIWLLSLLLTSAVLCVSFFISPWLTGFLLITCTIAAFVLAMPGIKYCLKAIWKLDLYKKLLFLIGFAAYVWGLTPSLQGAEEIIDNPLLDYKGVIIGVSIVMLFYLISCTPVIAAFNRRMHDINLSGWWTIVSCPIFLLVKVLPQNIFGKTIIILPELAYMMFNLYIMFKKGNPEENKYGLPPQ